MLLLVLFSHIWYFSVISPLWKDIGTCLLTVLILPCHLKLCRGTNEYIHNDTSVDKNALLIPTGNVNDIHRIN